MRRKQGLLLAIAGVALSGPALAQAPDGQLPPELLACAQVTDVERRLECFDREMAKLSDAPDSELADAAPQDPEPAPEPVAAPAPVTEPEPAVADAPQLESTPPPTSEPAPSVASTAEPLGSAATGSATTAVIAVTAPESETAEAPSRDDFGLSDREPEQISAVVTDIAHRPYGEFVVLLDNGQIWEQKHRDSRFRIDVGDPVTISEGLVSGFRLSAGGRNNSVQVERLK